MSQTAPLISEGVRAKLQAARVARLSTLDAQHEPHLIPICFVFDGKFFYSAIDRKPKRVRTDQLARIRNIQRNPQVALLVDHYEGDWSRLWYVLVRGKAELVSVEAERHKAIAQLMAKYPQYAAGMLADDAPVLRITPERITTWGKFES